MTAVIFSRGRDQFDAQPTQRVLPSFDKFEMAVLQDRSKRKGEAYDAAPFKVNGRVYRTGAGKVRCRASGCRSTWTACATAHRSSTCAYGCSGSATSRIRPRVIDRTRHGFALSCRHPGQWIAPKDSESVWT